MGRLGYRDSLLQLSDQYTDILVMRFLAASQSVTGYRGQYGLYIFRDYRIPPLHEGPGLGASKHGQARAWRESVAKYRLTSCVVHQVLYIIKQRIGSINFRYESLDFQDLLWRYAGLKFV